mmetsp:Transcript_9825/g.17114  ORF Transcript_9825/g.17114 Transcript_9825/m.17114 type:complete len:205 (+) Transcript_9825:2653-3267(+)
MRICQPPEKELTRRSPSSSVKPSCGIMRWMRLSISWILIPSASRWSTSISWMSLSSSAILAFAICSSTSAMASWTCRARAKACQNSSLTVRRGSTSNSCVRYEMRYLSGMYNVPLVGSSIPRMIFSCVVFPAPLAPTRPTRSPGLTSQVTSFRTSSLGNILLIFSRRRNSPFIDLNFGASDIVTSEDPSWSCSSLSALDSSSLL